MNMTKERKGKERKNKIVTFSDREDGAILVLIFLRQEWPKVIQYPVYSSIQVSQRAQTIGWECQEEQV